MTAVRRSEGPRPGGTDGERASGTTTKYSPVGREGIRTSTVVRGKGEGRGTEERRAPRKPRGTKSNERSVRRKAGWAPRD